MNTPPRSRSVLATRIAAAAALACLAPSTLHALDRTWTNSAGGSFGVIGNWDTGVPGVAYIANFTLNNTYTVTFAAGPTNTDLDVENGTVTFDLNGFTYSLTSASAGGIGNVAGQTGRLTITDGTVAVDTNGDAVTVGGASAGFLTVTSGGRLGDGTIRPTLTIGGGSGAGTLTVSDNGRIDAGILSIAVGSTGSATISGPNVVMTATAAYLGNSVGSSGGLSILNGGTLSTSSAAYLGSNLGSDGAVTVSGIGSSWTATQLQLGDFGDGTLVVSAGGLVSNSLSVSIGLNTTGIGAATVTGTNSRWDIPDLLIVGASGVGNLTISSGGTVTSSSAGGVFVGQNASGEGRVTVTGSGSRWLLNGGTFLLGLAGAGEVTVSSGGEVEANNVTFGSVASGTGVMTVTGAGSKVSLTGSATIGNTGAGTLNVTAGGEFYSLRLTTGDPAGAPIGTLNLDGGSIYIGDDFTNGGAFTFTDGLLQVAGDFQPNAAVANFTINGADNSDLPVLDLIGPGATTNVSTLNVASTRRGQLFVRESRLLSVGPNNVNIAASAGAEGLISVESGAQLVGTTGTLAVGGSGSTAGGAGTLDIAGGTVDIGTLRLHSGGVINLNGGTFAADSLATLNGQFNWTSGTVRLDAALSFLTATVASKLLGPAQTLVAGQSLTTGASQTVTIQTPLTVNGGAIIVNTLVNQSTLDIRAGDVNGFGSASNTGFVLLGHPLAAFGGTALTNDGTIRGTGRITGPNFDNNVAGRVDVIAGERLVIEGVTENFGTISVIGGELQVLDSFDNEASTGLVSARDAILRFTDVINNGSFAFSNGTVDVYGDITQNPGGARITVSNGGIANFYDDVTIGGGAASVHATALGSIVSRVVFFGSYNGGLTGGGQAFIEGDHRPGASPALVTFGGDVVYGSFASVEMELAGTARGTEYDAINVAGQLAFGGTLDVPLISGFQPQGGDVFNLFDWGSTAGTFSTVNLPALMPGLSWSQANLYTAGEIQVALDPAFTGRVWDGGGANNNWATDFNWDLNVEPLNNGTAQLIFAGNVRLTPSVDTAWNVASITFNNTAGAFTITGPQGITVGSGGISNNDADPQIIAAVVTLGTSQSFTAAAGDLAFANVAIGANTLTIAGANDVELDDVTGTGTITKTGAGTLDLIGQVGSGGITLNLNAGTTNISESQTLAALHIGAGAAVILGAPGPAPATHAVPEPASLAFIGLGTLMLMARRRGMAPRGPQVD